MYLVVIAWLYVVLMAALVEATSNVGTVLGAVVTFVLYGLSSTYKVRCHKIRPSRTLQLWCLTT